MENTFAGNKFSIVSLQANISEICRAINEVMSRTGPVKFASWKFPDQAAMDVDVEALLAKYTFIEADMEQSILAHNCLLELLIDRLIVFIQTVTQHIEMNVVRPRSEFLYSVSATSSRSTPQTSTHSQNAGAVLSHLWSNILQLQKILIRIQGLLTLNGDHDGPTTHSLQSSKASVPSTNEAGSHDARCKDASMFPELKDSVEVYAKQHRVSRQSRDLQEEAEVRAGESFNVSARTTSSTNLLLQTSSNALLEYLQDVGQLVMKTTKERGLPSSLEKCSLQRLADSLVLAPGHLTEWCDDVARDIQRITKYVGDLELQLHSFKEGTRQTSARHDHMVASLQQENQELSKKQEALLAHIRSLELVGVESKTQDLENEVSRLQSLELQQQERLNKYDDELAALRTQWEIKEIRYQSQIADLEARLSPTDAVQEGSSEYARRTISTGVQADPRITIRDDGDLEGATGVHSQAMVDAEMSRLRAQLEIAYGRIEEMQQRMKYKEKLGYQSYKSQSLKPSEETARRSNSKEHRPSTSDK